MLLLVGAGSVRHAMAAPRPCCRSGGGGSGAATLGWVLRRRLRLLLGSWNRAPGCCAVGTIAPTAAAAQLAALLHQLVQVKAAIEGILVVIIIPAAATTTPTSRRVLLLRVLLLRVLLLPDRWRGWRAAGLWRAMLCGAQGRPVLLLMPLLLQGRGWRRCHWLPAWLQGLGLLGHRLQRQQLEGVLGLCTQLHWRLELVGPGEPGGKRRGHA